MSNRIRQYTVLAVAAAGWMVYARASASEDGPRPCQIEDLRTLQETFADLADKVRPTVVAVRTYRAVGLGDGSGGGTPIRVADNQGAGVVIRADGYMVTNEHVVAGADKIDVVTHAGDYYDGVLVQSDPRSDLAVIKIDARNLAAARWGDVSRLRQGHWTFAVGNPFGLAADGALAFTVGNVTAIGKSLTPELDPSDTRYYGELIQTSTAINPGNSGGPLFNIDGEVIGICTAMLSGSGANEGVGFAVPICARTRRIIETLQTGQRVQYGYLGVKVATPAKPPLPLSGTDARRGAVVLEVRDRDSPAARAGLQPGDIIVALGDEAVRDSDHLVRLCGDLPVGNTVEVKYLRDGTEQRTRAEIGERPVPATDPDAALADRVPLTTLRWHGTLLAEQPDPMLSAAGLTRADAGVVVLEVNPISRAYKAGLRAGDVIMKYNGSRVRTLADFSKGDRTSGSRIRLRLMGGKDVRLDR